MLALDDYQGDIALGEAFIADSPVGADAYPTLLNELLGIFGTEAGHVLPQTSSTQEQRRALQALLTVRPANPLDPDTWHKLDQLFQFEKLGRPVVTPVELPPISTLFSGCRYAHADRTMLWQGDISLLGADAITNAANSAMLGCFQPFHACIDNVIHSCAGPRLREDCQMMMQLQGHAEETGNAKLSRAYHLPSRYVAHTVGPIVSGGQPTQHQQQQLANCYRNILDICEQWGDIHSVAFCCISTGVFGYPQEPAARVAINAVEQWRLEHPHSKVDTVIFNVFRDDDLEIYTRVFESY